MRGLPGGRVRARFDDVPYLDDARLTGGRVRAAGLWQGPFLRDAFGMQKTYRQRLPRGHIRLLRADVQLC